MPGLDDTHQELKRFRLSLARFDESLTASVSELHEIEDRLHGLWDDEFRREFEARRREVSEPVHAFVSGKGKQYLEFLDFRIRTLARYLGHG